MPASTLERAALVAWQTRSSRTSTALSSGCSAISCAAAPETCGAAIEVPERVVRAVSESALAPRMADPGAKRSTHAPSFENDERLSEAVLEPTVRAPGAEAGL